MTMAKTTKTAEGRALRQQAQRVVDEALEMLLAGEDAIAWASGAGLIGRLVDFQGDLPSSSGHHEVCTMASKVDRLRSWPDSHRRSLALFSGLTEAQKWAVAYDRARRGRKVAVAHDPLSGPLVWLYDDPLCARELDCTVSQFQKRVYEGYKRLEDWL